MTMNNPNTVTLDLKEYLRMIERLKPKKVLPGLPELKLKKAVSKLNKQLKNSYDALDDVNKELSKSKKNESFFSSQVKTIDSAYKKIEALYHESLQNIDKLRVKHNVFKVKSGADFIKVIESTLVDFFDFDKPDYNRAACAVAKALQTSCIIDKAVIEHSVDQYEEEI